MIQGWFAAHNLKVPRLPVIGRIVDGVAAGFLTMTDSGVAFLEAFVTNPAAPAKERDRAVDDITRDLDAVARMSGFDQLLILTTDQGLCARAVERHGFTYVGQKHGLLKEL